MMSNTMMLFVIAAFLMVLGIAFFSHIDDESWGQTFYRCRRLFILYIIAIPCFRVVVDNDFWFIYASGKDAALHGLSQIDTLSMHSGLHAISQQWVVARVFYYIYNAFGGLGVCLFVIPFAIASSYVCYRICLLISKNEGMSYLLSALFALGDSTFVRTRPYVFSLLLLILVVYCIERYCFSNDWRCLIPIPFLSIILVNVHSSMWLMLFVFALPFVVEGIISLIPCLSSRLGAVCIKRRFSVVILLTCLVLSFICGFINPFGTKAMFYVLSSYGISSISATIIEMLPINITMPISSMCVILFGALAIALFFNRRKIYLGDLFLLVGCIYLALTNQRSLMFMSFAIAVFIASLVPYAPELVRTKSDTFSMFILVILTVSFTFAGGMNFSTLTSPEPTQQKETYNYIDKHYSKERIVLFASYNDGGYAEFRGYKPYIDPRAEVFVKKMNKKADIFQEFVNISNNKGNLALGQFISKYKFTVMVVNTGTLLDREMKLQSDFTRAYSNSYQTIYVRNDLYKEAK